MSLLDSYVDRDVVKHFASLMADMNPVKSRVVVLGTSLVANMKRYALTDWLPDWVTVEGESTLGLEMESKGFIDKLIAFTKADNVILTVKKQYLELPGSYSTLKAEMDKGADIRVVEDILGAMVVASRKRRNKVIFPITGYEDEGLITAAGLAKAKTVGFRNFFVFNHHWQTKGIIEALAASEKQVDGFILPLKVGLNTGVGAFSSIPLVYNKGVVVSGYEPMEIMQSIWMVLNQKSEGAPAAVYQRTKEVSDEIVNRSRWMLEEVFEPADIMMGALGLVKSGSFRIREKYQAFDAKNIGFD